MNKLIQKRLEELETQAAAVEATAAWQQSDFFSGMYVDDDALLKWKVKTKETIARIYGKDSQYFIQFESSEKATGFGTNHSIFRSLAAVFSAAKEDFEAGHHLRVQTLVQAEVFDTELEQAEELFKKQYFAAAAVIAGVVLETTLRELCKRKNIQQDRRASLDKMNADLARADSYNILVQKRVTALASIRNSAAHGKHEDYTETDVKDMIQGVRTFVEEHLKD